MDFLLLTYFGARVIVSESLYLYFDNYGLSRSSFMRQKCELQMDKAQHKNAATPLNTFSIITSHKHQSINEKSVLLQKLHGS